MCESNTDAVKFYIDEEYKEQASNVINAWENLTGLEMEEDNVVKCIARDVNNYAEILQIGDNNYEVHYKGGEFKGKHIFKWDKENKVFHYSFKDDLTANSLTIVGEALLKKLLFDIPIEDTINNCNDIFRFQMITHLGSTYEKCVQESPNGDIELQRNNRIYAGNVSRGTLIKIKPNGRRDSVANCPPNPIVDNANQLTINDINKSWYIKFTKKKYNDFIGVKRLSDYKKEELLDIATKYGFNIDKKIKKDELVRLLDEREETVMAVKKTEVDTTSLNIYQKLDIIRTNMRTRKFVMDTAMPGNLGGKEYASIGQYYDAIHTESAKVNTLFRWETNDLVDFREDLFKPIGKMPSSVATVRCRAIFTNCDKPEEQVVYECLASGSDICDKAVSGASTLAFRNFIDKNFTPSYMNNVEEEIADTNEEEKTETPKVPVFIPAEKKEEIKKEVVAEVQKEEGDNDDVKQLIDKIMKVRELLGRNDWGVNTLRSLQNGEITSADILEIELKVNSKLESLGA